MPEELFYIPNKDDAASNFQSEVDRFDLSALAARYRVASGGAVTQEGVPAMSVAVEATTFNTPTGLISLSADSLAISASDDDDPRFDLIVATELGFDVIEGLQAGHPVFPDVDFDTNVLLAAVLVDQSASVITDADIIQKQVRPPQIADDSITLGTPQVGALTQEDLNAVSGSWLEATTGGTTGQLLGKTSGVDYDVSWQEVLDVLNADEGTVALDDQALVIVDGELTLVDISDLVDEANSVTINGLTGSVAVGRLVGFTTTGAPSTGAHLTGDVVFAENGHIFICTLTGTPGTWVEAGAGTYLPLAGGTVTGPVIIDHGTGKTELNTVSGYPSVGIYDSNVHVNPQMALSSSTVVGFFGGSGAGLLFGPGGATAVSIYLAYNAAGELKTNAKVIVADATAATHAVNRQFGDARYVLQSLFDANTILFATTDNTPAALTVGASTFVGRKASGNISAMSTTEAATLLTDLVPKSLYDANSVVTATANDTPIVTTMAAGTVLGRRQTGDIDDVTYAQIIADTGGNPYLMQPKTTEYTYTPHVSRTTAANVLQRMYFVPIWIWSPWTADRIGVEVTAGGATSVMRLGIYTSTDGRPDSRVLEASGTQDGNSTGLNPLTISQALTEGQYWLAVVAQTAVCTLRTMNAHTFNNVPSTAPSGSGLIGGWIQNSVSGALPSTATPVASGNNISPLVFLRRT